MSIIFVARRFLIHLVKQWLGYIFQATGAVVALVFSPYLQYGADVRLYAEYFILGYSASVLVVRITYANNRWGLLYQRQFFRFMRWFIAILAAIFAPLVVGLFPFLTISGIVPKLAIILIVFFLLLYVGTVLGMSDIFKDLEDIEVQRFQKRYATPDYEAILKGEEFEYHSKPPLTRRERLGKWWEERQRLWRRLLRDLRHP